MRKIGKIATETEQIIKNYQQSNVSDTQTQQQSNHTNFDDISARDNARAASVWVRMSEIHGALFVSNFGETPPAVWVRTISKMSDIEIQRALTNCLRRTDKFPPTLNEFLMLSRDERRHPSHKICKPPRLTRKKNKSVARAELKKMRAILGFLK